MANVSSASTPEHETLVTTYLEKNPKVLEKFLSTHPEVTQHLTLPSQHQNGVTDFHNFKTQKLEKEITRLKAKNTQLLNMSVDNLRSQAQIHTLVLNILNATSLTELLTSLSTHLKKEMAVDHIHLRLCNDAPLQQEVMHAATQHGHTTIATNQLNTLFEKGTLVTLRTLYAAEEKELHGPWAGQAASDGLLKIVTPSGIEIGILALVSKDQARFHKGQGVELLNFIAQIIGQVMARWVFTQNIKKTG